MVIGSWGRWISVARSVRGAGDHDPGVVVPERDVGEEAARPGDGGTGTDSCLTG